MWRVKHEGHDALAIQRPGAPVVVFVYACEPDAETQKVQEVTVDEPPTERTTVAWFYEIDRETVMSLCRSVPPPKEAKEADGWLTAVVNELFRRSLLFWKDESEQDLIAWGLVDDENSPACKGDWSSVEDDEEYNDILAMI